VVEAEVSWFDSVLVQQNSVIAVTVTAVNWKLHSEATIDMEVWCCRQVSVFSIWGRALQCAEAQFY